MKNKILNVILIILILATIIVSIIITKKYYDNYKNEENLNIIVEDFKNEIANNKNDKSEKENKKVDIKYKGFNVLGIIEIPKINMNYPILSETTDETMEISITKFWGNNVNEVGNFTMVGHNFFDNTLFGRIDELKINDEIYLTDASGNMLKYGIFDKYIIDPNDTSCVKSVKKDTKEITLITCTEGRSKRLVIKAREI